MGMNITREKRPDRVIKFRAWDKNKKVMVYDSDEKWRNNVYPVSVTNKGIIFCEKGKWGQENEVKNEIGETGYKQWEYDKYYLDIELMQYTGLKDNNGNEIFEGDIVKWEAFGFTQTFEVKWSDRKCGFNIKPKYISEMEVIGNIYSNPELLEVKK